MANDCDGQIDEGVCVGPVVMCPGARTVAVGESVVLTASATDVDGRITSTQWSVTSSPPGSVAQPSTPSAQTATFTPDLAGTFTVRFCANDNEGNSACCATSVTTFSCASPPSPPISTACSVSWDGRPIVQFAPIPTGLTYELATSGRTLVLGSALEGHNHVRPAVRAAPGGPLPGASVGFEVRACRTDAPTCCSGPTQLSVNVVEECAVAAAPSAANVVVSEYVVNGEGACPSPDCINQDTCQAGESIELTNLSNCPVNLNGFHFAYRNASASTASSRWMNFGSADVIPPRGVYVAIRNRQFAPTCTASLGPQSQGLYGLRISALTMSGANLCSGWFNNSGGGSSELQLAAGTVAPGSIPTFAGPVARVAPYLSTGSAAACSSIGFDAVDSCGTIVGGSSPTAVLAPNQLGRLWHPCDAVLGAAPACIRD